MNAALLARSVSCGQIRMVTTITRAWGRLIVLSLLLGCSEAFDSGDERELSQAKERWENAGLVDYQLEVRLSCFCPGAFPVFTRLQVQAGEVVAAEPLEATQGSDQIPLDAWPTVPDVFGLIEGASHQSGIEEIEAQYHPTLGYPTRVEIRCKKDVLDCGALYELQNLTSPKILDSSMPAAARARLPER